MSDATSVGIFHQLKMEENGLIAGILRLDMLSVDVMMSCSCSGPS